MQLARVCHFELAEKSFGPAPAEMTREFERKNSFYLRYRAGVRFLGKLEMTDAGQLRNSYCWRQSDIIARKSP